MTRTTRAPWLGIELRHLAALSAVSREGSFRGAAESLGYVQSAVSQQLAHLERLVGARLVDRRRGSAPVTLTAPGEILLHHFDEILACLGAAEADMRALREGRTGRLRVGAYEPVASRVMPHILVSLANDLPGVEVQMNDAHCPNELATHVETGELDISFGEFPLPPGPFEVKEVLRDPYVLLAPAGWSIADSGEPLTPEELSTVPLVMNGEGPVSEQVDVELRAQGVEPRYVFRCGIQTAAPALVAAGIGATILPRLSVDESDERTIAVELGELLQPRVMVLYWHRDRRGAPSLDAFVEAAAQACLETTTGAPTYVEAA